MPSARRVGYIGEDGFLRGSAEFRTSPMLTSLGTFLFSNKKVPLRRIQCSKWGAKFQFDGASGILIPKFGYNDSKSPTMVPGVPVKADNTSTGIR